MINVNFSLITAMHLWQPTYCAVTLFGFSHLPIPWQLLVTWEELVLFL